MTIIKSIPSKGDKSNEVLFVQRGLNKFGKGLFDKLVEDGIWGAKTSLAIIKFKVSKDLFPSDILKDYILEMLEIEVAGEQEIDRPSDPMPEGYLKEFKEPTFVVVKGTKYVNRGEYKTPTKMFKGLVVHYTVSGRTAASAIGNVKYLASKGYGCMVMDENGIIYIPEDFDVLKDWGHHAGVSKWGSDTYVSNKFAGMEICGWGLGSKVGPIRSSKGEDNIIAGDYQEYTPEQETALDNFILWALSKNKEFKIANVVGHDELREAAGQKGGKTDPGASLSRTMPNYRAHLNSLV